MNRQHHHEPAPKPDRPDWRRIHHSPLFWIGVGLFLTAITVYLWSEDLSWRPRLPQQ